ncbi:MAG: hypothetical protein CVU84_00950 [Firmicutes bacterium HGW-Firmicutes-1]|jgi:hypothetical protein|nr:MAG: hypothetical protein CVU84_00950 [Firmicutes bacterium HGW-Firmicutes-1]
MITAYLVGITMFHEDEDIEIRYAIFEDDKLINKACVFEKYRKPLVVSQIALIKVLKELEKYKDQEITIVINDEALNEQIRGTSTTKNREVIKMAGISRSKIKKLGDSVLIKNVSQDKLERDKWNEILIADR